MMVQPAKSTATANILAALDGRGKELDPRLWSYKLTGTTYGIDTTLTDKLEVDEQRMSVVVPIADGRRRDGVGDLLVCEGVRLERHRRNPIILLDHGKQLNLPIGIAEDPDTKEYTVFINAAEKNIKAKAFFYQGKRDCDPALGCKQYDHALTVEQTFDLCAKGFLRSGSIGYQVISAESLAPDYHNGTPQGLLLKEILCLEGSIVTLPANQDTAGKSLVDGLNKVLADGQCCGKPLSPYLVKAFSPYAPPKRAQVVGGYSAKSARVPNYRQADDPEKSCETCSAFTPEGGRVGHCKMFDVEVGPDATCDRWTARSGGKSMTHGPDCKCIKCQEKYGTKACGCKSCSEGKSCPCGDTKAQPSEHVDPDKACTILRDGEANGKPLTDAQRGMFGAACNEKGEYAWDGKSLKALRGKYKANDHTGVPGVRPPKVPGATDVGMKAAGEGAAPKKPKGGAAKTPKTPGGGRRKQPAAPQAPAAPAGAQEPSPAAPQAATPAPAPAPAVNPTEAAAPAPPPVNRESQTVVSSAGRGGGAHRSVASVGQAIDSHKSPREVEQLIDQEFARLRGEYGQNEADRFATAAMNLMRQRFGRESQTTLHHPHHVGEPLGGGEAPASRPSYDFSQVEPVSHADPGDKPVIRNPQGRGLADPEKDIHDRVAASDALLSSAPAERIQSAVNANARQLMRIYGPEWANRYVEQMEAVVRRYRPDVLAPGKSLGSLSHAKGLKDLRTKYRKAHGRLRRVRKSSPGSATIHISHLDLDKLRESAHGKGVECKWIGDEDDGKTVKVKLMGDDKVIDELAAKHGRRKPRRVDTKSLPVPEVPGVIGTVAGGSRERVSLSPETLLNSPMGTEVQVPSDATPVVTGKNINPQTKGKGMKTKDATDMLEKPEDGGAPHMEGNPDLGADEPYGLQVTRRIHADHAGLLHEYDELLQHVEDESTRKLMTKLLEQMVETLEEIENHKDGHERYKDYPDFDGRGAGDDINPEGDLGGKPDEALEADSGEDEEPTPDEALEGMKEDEDKEPTAEEKALYFKRVKALRAGYKGLQSQTSERKAYIEKRLKSLAGKKDAGSLEEAKYLQKQLKSLGSVGTKDAKPKSVVKGGPVPGSDEEKHGGMKTTPKMPGKKALDDEKEEEKKYLSKRWKALKAFGDDDEDAKEEKSYIVKRWKALKDEEEKDKKDKAFPPDERDEESETTKSVKKLAPRHHKSAGELVSFLKDLSETETKDFDDNHRLKAYHHGCKAHETVKDIFGGEKAFDNLAKALVLYGKDFPKLGDGIELNAPSSNAWVKPGHDKMPYDEGKHAATGAKDFPKMGGGTHAPSSNPQVKPGHDDMPYDEGKHAIAGVKGGFPEMAKEAGEAGVESPSSNPQVAKLGKEPMQQFGGASLVKYLKFLADAGTFLKYVSGRKDFGEADRHKALLYHTALKDMGETDAKSEFPGDRAFWEEEEEEAEHHKKELETEAHKGMEDDIMEDEEEKAMEPGEMGEKSLHAVARQQQEQQDAIQQMFTRLNGVLTRLG